MKTKTHILFLFIGLTIISCATPSKMNKESISKIQKESACENLVWYRFINDKVSRSYLNNTKKVAERWGFKIVNELGSGANSEEDKQRKTKSEEKSRMLFECLEKTIGENWRNKFYEDVKTEHKNN